MKRIINIFLCLVLLSMTLVAQAENIELNRIDKVASYGIGAETYKINFTLDSLDLGIKPVSSETNGKALLSIRLQNGVQPVGFTTLVFTEKESPFSKRKLAGKNTTASEPEYFDDFGTLEIEGVPELPVYTINLPIPDDVDSVWLENVSITYGEPISCGDLYPCQHILEVGEHTFTVNGEYYSYDGFDYFGDAVTVSEPYMYHGVRGVTVSIMPVQNNPAQKNGAHHKECNI